MMLYTKRTMFHGFTLVELIVSMAIFSLLLLIVMNFFNGSQKLVSKNGQNNDMYADARAAMDLMATMISSTYYAVDANYAIASDGGISVRDENDAKSGFLFERAEQSNSTYNEPSFDLFFAVKPDLNNYFFTDKSYSNVKDVFFVRICRGEDDAKTATDPEKKKKNKKYRLYINYIKPDVSGYMELFPPYKKKSWDDMRDEIVDEIMQNSTYMEEREIIRNVVGLEFVFFKKFKTKDLKKVSSRLKKYFGAAPIEIIIDGDKTVSNQAEEKYKLTDDQADEYQRTPPYMIEIRLSLLTDAQMLEFCSLTNSSEQKEYLQRNRRTFTRLVPVGEYGLDAMRNGGDD